MFICLECLKTFNRTLKKCPISFCFGEVVEIDDLMIPNILLLKKLGWKSLYCCSGHPSIREYFENSNGVGNYSPYIVLEFNYDEYTKNSKYFKSKVLPLNWKIESKEKVFNNKTYDHTYRVLFRHIGSESYEDIINANISFKHWLEKILETETS